MLQGLWSSGMYLYVTGLIVSNVSNDHSPCNIHGV